jgi:hypothetical protein
VVGTTFAKDELAGLGNCDTLAAFCGDFEPMPAEAMDAGGALGRVVPTGTVGWLPAEAMDGPVKAGPDGYICSSST